MNTSISSFVNMMKTTHGKFRTKAKTKTTLFRCFRVIIGIKSENKKILKTKLISVVLITNMKIS